MSRALSEFGGWLKFFYITLWIGLVLVAFYMLMLLPGLFTRQLDAVYTFVFMIDNGLCVLFAYKLIQATKTQEADVPNRIVRWLSYILLVSCLFAVPEIYFARMVYGVVGVRRIVFSVIKIIIWFCVWTAYFRKSERVLAYYGKNADKFF